MSVKVEKTENKNEVKLEITVEAEKFEKAMVEAYNRNKNKIAIPGFRKGKAPYQIIEKTYGPSIFYEDAFNIVAEPAYRDAIDSEKLEVVSKPDVDITQIEKGKDLIFTVVVALKPDVKLGKYKGLSLEKTKFEVKEEDIDAELNQMADRNARMVSITDKPAKDGNTVTIDYIGTIDGVAFEGGRAEGYDLVLGSNTFIPGFEDQVIGMKVDEVKDIKVTFPEEYPSKEVAGKEANFNVTLHEIKQKELPKIDDEFAKDVSEFDSLKELKADIKAKKEKQNDESAKRALEDQAINKVIETSEIDIPNGMIDVEIDNMVEEMNNTFQYQYPGFTFEQYLKMIGKSMTDYRNEAKDNAVQRIKTRLVIEAIAKDAKIEASEEEIDAKIKEIDEMYKMGVDKLKEINGFVDNVKHDVCNEKAIQLIIDEAKVKEVANKEEEKKSTKTAKKEEEKDAKKTTKKSSK